MSAGPVTVRPRAGVSPLAGMGLVLRFFVRRNWLLLLVWPAVVVGMTAMVVAYYKNQFGTPEALAGRAVLSGSAGMRTVFGHVTSTGLGGGVWAEMWMFTAMMLAIGMVFLVTRNNRADEEHGRTELLRSRPIAALTTLTATVSTLTVLCVLCAVGTAIVCGAYGLGWTGSWIMGASLGSMGLLGVAVAALTNQLTVASRDANGLALGVLAVFYLVRAVGDLKNTALTWASPIGWSEKMDPWGHNLWGPLAVVLVVCAGCVAAAFGLQRHRDYGAGIVQPHPGSSRQTLFASTEFGLTVRLSRVAAIAWTTGLALWGVLLGSTIHDMSDLAPQLSQISGGTSVDSIIGLWMRITALIVATLVAHHILTLRTDEEHGLIELRLAGAISRWLLVGARLAYTAILTVVSLTIAGVAMGLVYGQATADLAWVGRLAIAGLSYLPSLAVVAGLATACYGWLPYLATPLTWSVVVLVWITSILGTILKIPGRILDRLPFTSINLPATSPSPITTLVTAGIAVVFIALGLVGVRYRDVPA